MPAMRISFGERRGRTGINNDIAKPVNSAVWQAVSMFSVAESVRRHTKTAEAVESNGNPERMLQENAQRCYPMRSAFGEK
jgi:hypothetical protein